VLGVWVFLAYFRDGELGAKRLHLQVVNGIQSNDIVTRCRVVETVCGGVVAYGGSFVLLTSWVVFRGIGWLGVSVLASWQASARYALAVMFVMTGSAHFTRMKHDLERMVPRFFPQSMGIVYCTGVLEFLGAAGLLLPRVRGVAGVCLIILLIAMFPANIRAARERLLMGGKPATALWLRVPMQVFFIGLIWWASR
jgi:uncharacterized membrane protein